MTQKHAKENRDERNTQTIVFRLKDELSPITFYIQTKNGLKASGVVMPIRMQ